MLDILYIQVWSYRYNSSVLQHRKNRRNLLPSCSRTCKISQAPRQMTIKFFFSMLRSCKSWDWALPRRENGMRLEGVLTSCCFSSLYLGRRDAITLRSRMRVMRLGRPLLFPLFLLSSSSPSSSFFSSFSSFFFLRSVPTPAHQKRDVR